MEPRHWVGPPPAHPQPLAIWNEKRMPPASYTNITTKYLICGLVAVQNLIMRVVQLGNAAGQRMTDQTTGRCMYHKFWGLAKLYYHNICFSGKRYSSAGPELIMS